MRGAILAILLAITAPSISAQQSKAEELLDNEPEMQEFHNFQKAPIGNWYTVRANEDLRHKMAHKFLLSLSNRLLDALLACEGRCNDQRVREDEFWLLQQEVPGYDITPYPVRDTTPTDSRWSLAPADREFTIYTNIRDYCHTTAEIDKNQGETIVIDGKTTYVEPDPIKKEKALQLELSCIKKFDLIGKRHPVDPQSPSPFWDTHVAVWKTCAKKYHIGGSIFQQQAYDKCMNDHDVETMLRTLSRAAELKHGMALAPFPTDGDLKNFKDVQTIPESQL